MLVLAVTGGVASGKSTVVGMLRELGAEVIDADEIARQVTEPQEEGWRRIREAFGPEYFGPDGRLRRRELGRLVFANPDLRRRLEGLLHPLIIEEIGGRVEQMRSAPGSEQRIVVIEAPVLIEAGATGLVDRILVVTAEQSTQARRLTERGEWTEKEIAERIASQMPQQEKLRYADYVIDTDCAISETRRQVEALWRRVQMEVGSGGSGLSC